MVLVSIIIPAYNASQTIGRTVRSLACVGEHANEGVEAIVVDDGSDDETVAVVEQARRGIEHVDVRLLTREHEGVCAARNAGMDAAEGEWMLFLDADDELLRDPASVVLAHADASAVGAAVVYEEEGREPHVLKPRMVREDEHLDRLTAENPFTISSLIFRTDAVTQRFDVETPYLEDWLFWLMNPGVFDAMAVAGGDPLARIHLHEANRSGDRAQMGAGRERVAALTQARYGDELSGKAQRNLAIQAQIGRLLQGEGMAWSTFAAVPCDGRLWLKAWAYRLGLA